MLIFGMLSKKMPLSVLVAILIIAASVVSAQDDPCLEVNPKVLNFYGQLYAPYQPDIEDRSQGFMVFNCGGGTLNWTGTPQDPWIGMEPTQGTNFDSVMVWIIMSGLPDIFIPPEPGDTILLEGRIIIEADGADNSPQEVLVNYHLIYNPEPYYILVEPHYFELRLAEGDAREESFKVYESYGRNVLVDFSNNSQWLQLPLFIAPVFTPATISFQVSAGDLDPGVYYDTISIHTYIDGTSGYRGIPVKLIVGESGYSLNSIPDHFEFKLSDLGYSPAGSLYVFEESGASINFWTFNHSDWLYVDTMAATPLYTPATIFVNILADTLAPGYYYDTVFIDAAEVDQPHAVPVKLSIGMEENMLATAPRAFDVKLYGDMEYLDTLHIYEISGGEVPFQISKSQPWLQIDPFSSTPPFDYATPEYLTVRISTDTLPIGIFHDTILIEPIPGDPDQFRPVGVPVTLTVLSHMPRVKTNPYSFKFYAGQRDTIIRQSLFVYEVNDAHLPFHWMTTGQSEWLQLPMIEILLLTPNSFRFTVSTEGLEPGVYRDSIIIFYPFDDRYGFEDVFVPVELVISETESDYWVFTAPTAFIWSTIEDKIILDTLLVYEIEGNQIPFTYYNKHSWLTVNPLRLLPDVTPRSLPAVANTAGLVPGVYLDTIMIVPVDRTHAFIPRAVPVVLNFGSFYNGDANRDNTINISDAVYLLNYIFRHGSAPLPMDAGDANCDGEVNIGDVVNVLHRVFKSGSSPECGE